MLVNREDYTNSMMKIISDASKFLPITEPLAKFNLKIEDKVNRFLLKLKNLKIFSDDLY